MKPGKKRVVLIGAGHAHLYTIMRLGRLIERGFEATVISPGKFWYSGLATGMLGGAYPPELDQVDTASIAKAQGAAFVSGTLKAIDHAKRSIVLEDSTSLPFDVLSVNIGSACRPIPGEDARCFQVKPIERLLALRQQLERDFSRPDRTPLAVVIAGGGVTAFEIAGNIKALAERSGRDIRTTILCGPPTPLPELPAGAVRRIMDNFRDRDVRVNSGSRVARIHNNHAELDNGRRVRFDYFVNATGLVPNTRGKDLDLPMDATGGIRINSALRVLDHQNIFAVGDCASFVSRPLPKIGVYAIRQAPILFRNIAASLDGSVLQHYVPQRRFLSILTLGDGNGLAVRGSLWWYGRLAFWLKDWIDRRFLKSIQPQQSLKPEDFTI